MARARKRLSNKSEIDLLEIPPFLLRKNWTKEDYERSEKAWDRVQKETREKQLEALQLRNKQIFAKSRRIKHHKIMREYNREQRNMRNLERKARRAKKERIQEEHDGMVIGALRQGDETVGQINKRLEISTKDARRSLKRLMKKARVIQISPRRYQLNNRKRRRLSDVKD